MVFFAESTYEESYQDLGIVVNDYTDFDMLALEACDIIEEMNNAILYGIGHYELDMIREGAEVVYTEGMLDSIKDKITDIWNHSKNWIANVWNKFIAYIESYIRGDKEFLQKYDKQLKENLNYLDKDFKKTYKYAGVIINPPMVTDEIIELNKKRAEELLKQFDKNGNKLKDADVFKKYTARTTVSVYTALSKGRKEAMQLDRSEDVDSKWIKKNFNNIKSMLLMDIPKIKKILDKSVKASDDVFKKVYDKIMDENIDTYIDNGFDFDKRTKSKMIAYQMLSSILSKHFIIINGFMIKCIKRAKSDARSMCRVILSANKPTNESTFESYFNI